MKRPNLYLYLPVSVLVVSMLNNDCQQSLILNCIINKIMHINPKGQSVSKSSSICMQEIKPLTDDTKYNARSSLVRSSLVHSSLYTSFFNKSWNYDTPIFNVPGTLQYLQFYTPCVIIEIILKNIWRIWIFGMKITRSMGSFYSMILMGIFWIYQRINLFWHARSE